MGFEPDVITYSSLIHACAKSSQVERAFQLVDKMQQQGVKPDVIMCNSLIQACSNSSQVKKAFQLLESLQPQELECDSVGL